MLSLIFLLHPLAFSKCLVIGGRGVLVEEFGDRR